MLTYVNIQLVQLCFLLRKDIINYRDINIISFFNNSIICFIINIDSDEQQSVLKYLKGIEININNVLTIMGNFNIRNIDWDPLYSYYSVHTGTPIEIADSFDLSLSTPISQVSTNNPDGSNSVINFIFLQNNSSEINNYLILLDSRSSSDHASLTVDIIINKEFIQDKQCTIIKNSKEDDDFIKKLKIAIGNIDISNISNRDSLENTI